MVFRSLEPCLSHFLLSVYTFALASTKLSDASSFQHITTLSVRRPCLFFGLGYPPNGTLVDGYTWFVDWYFGFVVGNSRRLRPTSFLPLCSRDAVGRARLARLSLAAPLATSAVSTSTSTS